MGGRDPLNRTLSYLRIPKHTEIEFFELLREKYNIFVMMLMNSKIEDLCSSLTNFKLKKKNGRNKLLKKMKLNIIIFFLIA